MNHGFGWHFGKKLVLFAVMGLLALGAKAQEVTLSARKGAGLQVALSPTGGGPGDENLAVQFRQILSKDLEMAGTFTVSFLETLSPVSAQPDLQVNTQMIRGLIRRFMVQVDVIDVRTQKPIFKKTYTGSPEWMRRIAHRVADDFTERLTGLRGIADSRVVFSQETSRGIKEIFQVDRDGEGLRELTHYGSLTISPTLASDGRLAYVTYKGGPPEIWGQKIPGGPHVRFYPTGGNHPGAVSAPAWSPDGHSLAFVRGDRHGHSDLMVLEIVSGRVRQLTSEAGINTEPAWSPTGTTLAFTSDRDGSPQIYLMEADGSAPRRLTTEGSYNASPAWSPDGSRLAYVSRFEGRFDVFVYNLGEAKAYQITPGEGSSESPAWSPDGRWLTYTNTASGSARLMVSDLPGRIIQPLGYTARVQAPDWSRSR